jgi:hypothetical protein
MKLTSLDCSATQVADLTPLRGMPLCFLGIAGTPVRDLAPLKGMPLLGLNCASSRVSDLTPLEGMDLILLDASDVPVDNLTPLRGMPLRVLWCQASLSRDRELLRSLAALKQINGKPAPEGDGPLANEPKKKPVLTPHFLGKLIRVNGSDKSLTVQATPQVGSQSAYHTYWLGWHQDRLLEVSRDSNPGKRWWRIQDQLDRIAFHQAHLYTSYAANEEIGLLADDDVMVRTLPPPPAFDEEGKPRQLTAKEREKLKGPDRTLPGYSADFAALKPQQLVEVYLSRAAQAKAPPKGTGPQGSSGNEDAPEGKAVDPRPRVYMIVIQ